MKPTSRHRLHFVMILSLHGQLSSLPATLAVRSRSGSVATFAPAVAMLLVGGSHTVCSSLPNFIASCSFPLASSCFFWGDGLETSATVSEPRGTLVALAMCFWLHARGVRVELLCLDTLPSTALRCSQTSALPALPPPPEQLLHGERRAFLAVTSGLLVAATKLPGLMHFLAQSPPSQVPNLPGREKSFHLTGIAP